VHAGEEDHTQPGLTKSNRFTRLPVEESIRMTEDRYKWRKYVHGRDAESSFLWDSDSGPGLESRLRGLRLRTPAWVV